MIKNIIIFAIFFSLTIITLLSDRITNLLAFSPNNHKRIEEQMANIPRITCRQALALYQQGITTLIDAHHGKKVGKSEIYGAIHIPHNMIEKLNLKYSKNAIILTF